MVIEGSPINRHLEHRFVLYDGELVACSYYEVAVGSLRVLVVHNRHRAAVPSGENRAVDYDVALLRDAGVDVDTYFRSNDEIDSFGPARWVLLPTRIFYSLPDVRAFRRRLRATRPAVVHLHNPFPLISPWIVRVAHAEGVPIVQTVHNYTHVCAAGTYFRSDKGVICRACVGRALPWPAVRYACYRDSRLYSAVFGAGLVAARPTWRLIDRFLPVSKVVADHLVDDAGLPRERVTVKPNAVPDPGPQPPPGPDFLFIAGLHRKKGALLLLDAWERVALDSGHRLLVAGEGPQRAEVAARVTQLQGVDMIGAVPPHEVSGRMAAAGVVVMPSEWYEPLPLTAIEALAHGRPLIATGMGGLGDLVDSEVGWRVEPTVDALARALSEAAVADLVPLGVAARRRYLDRLAPERVIAQLVDIYDTVIKGRRPG
jgi:glycosyltransferase involved in cell wall biosynthesis